MTHKEELLISYISGVADSDGSFSYVRRYSSQRAKYYYNGMFQLTWKESEEAIGFMDELVGRYGGAYFLTTSHTALSDCPIVKYTLTGIGLVRLCKEVSPHLRLKKEQAMIALEGASLKREDWRGYKKSKEEWKKEEALYLRANKINTKNKKICV